MASQVPGLFVPVRLAKALVAGVACLAFLPVGVACAGVIGPQIERGDNVTVRVSIAALNLAPAAGARSALARVTAAARDICGPQPAITELARQRLYKACVASKVDKAVADIGSPLLASLTHHAPASLAEARR